MGVIYLRTNLVTGMQYVGKAKNFKKRENSWRCLKWRYANQLLTDEREKYGLDNFTVEILEECDNSKLNELERIYIEKYNTIYPDGYNDNEGGDIGFHPSERTKKKISEANSGEKNYWYGKKRPKELNESVSKKLKGKKKSEETKNKMSENSAKYWLGKEFSDEHKRKIGEASKGKFLNREDLSKKVYQYTLDGELVAIYPSRNEAGRAVGVRGTSIGNCCNGGFYTKGKWVNMNTVKGYRWSYIPL